MGQVTDAASRQSMLFLEPFAPLMSAVSLPSDRSCELCLGDFRSCSFAKRAYHPPHVPGRLVVCCVLARRAHRCADGLCLALLVVRVASGAIPELSGTGRQQHSRRSGRGLRAARLLSRMARLLAPAFAHSPTDKRGGRSVLGLALGFRPMWAFSVAVPRRAVFSGRGMSHRRSGEGQRPGCTRSSSELAAADFEYEDAS